MPELPEVEFTVRRLGAKLAGTQVESALAPGMNVMKSFEPPLEALAGREIAGLRRLGKMIAVDCAPDGDEGLSLLLHLMSAGRLRTFGKRASARDRSSRLLIRLGDGGELRLREFGTRQRAWAKLLPTGEVAADEMVATLGPDAWPAPAAEEFAAALDQPRHLHPLLRDQRTIAGIGRSWVDEILWEARLSPFRKGSELDGEELAALRAGLAVLGAAIEHYEATIEGELPDKAPKPLRIHKHEGEPCPRCGAELQAVYFAERQTTYCPREQTGGRILKDRRLSRLLK